MLDLFLWLKVNIFILFKYKGHLVCQCLAFPPRPVGGAS